MSPKRDPQRRALRLAEWPQTDRVLWDQAIRALDMPSRVDRLLTAAPRPLAAASRRAYRQAWGRFLGWLIQTGQLIASEHPGQRARPDRIAAFVDMHVDLGNCGKTIAGYLNGMAGALRMMRFPAEAASVAALGGVPIEARVDMEPRPVEVFHPRVLYRWALSLLHGADAERSALARQRAIRDGLLIGMLAARAFRSRTAHAMMYGQHLLQGDVVWLLRFGREDVKNQRNIAYPLPRSLQPWIDRYLQVERQELLAGSCPRKWCRRPPPG